MFTERRPCCQHLGREHRKREDIRRLRFHNWGISGIDEFRSKWALNCLWTCCHSQVGVAFDGSQPISCQTNVAEAVNVNIDL